MEGQTLRHYLVLDRLGQGGMGTVYKARDTRLDRVVALKVLREERAEDPESRRRFLQEARAASALNDPRIVTLHDIGSEDGVDFLVMEYVQGETLSSLIRPGGMPVLNALRYAEQVASAVIAAHAVGIVHRDLKPGNILVRPSGEVKVLDFGLAKLNRPVVADGPAAETHTLSLTSAGLILGTPSYMSPEQAVGAPVDHRSDIFSLGVILYEMLAGQRPFRGGNPGELIRATFYDAPSPLPREDVPEAAKEALRRALEKNRDQRYPTMAEFAGDLRRALEACGSGGGAQPALTPPGGPLRRWRRAVALGLAGVATVAVLVIAQRPEALVEPARKSASAAAAARPAHEYVAEARALLDRAEIPGNVEKAVALLRNSTAAYPSHAASHATLALALARLHGQEAQPELLREAGGHARHALSLDSQLALAHVAAGTIHHAQLHFAEAEKELHTAARLDPANAEVHAALGSLYYRTRDFPRSLAAYEEAVRRRADWVEARVGLGALYYQLGRYEDAERENLAAVNLAPDSPRPHQMLGAMYHLQGRFEEAARAYQRALEIRPTAALYSNLGTAYFFRQMYPEAAAAFQKAARMQPERYLYWGNLGDARRWMPDARQEAAAAYGKAIELARHALANGQDDADLRSRLALYLAKKGDHAAALEELTRVGESPGSKAGPLFYRCVVAYEVAGRRDEALRMLERAIQAHYSIEEIQRDPELSALRADGRFTRTLRKLAPKQTRAAR